jgi:hypothetical protein
VRLAGVMTKCYLFVLRMSYSGRAVHRVFATCGQEAFLEGHVHAFAVLGGVEGEVGYFRRNYLVPVPEVASLDELNARIEQAEQAEQAEDGRRIGSRIRSIGQDFASKRVLLAPLPEDPFETGLVLTPRVDRYGQVMVRNNRYSVPVRLIGRQVQVVLRSSELAVFYRNAEVARHPRLAAKKAASTLSSTTTWRR